MPKNKSISSVPITFQDHVLIAKATTANPLGEFHSPENFGGQPIPPNEIHTDSLSRLSAFINLIISEASASHQEENCVVNSQQIKKGRENHISRLITNEFFFYTKEPLNLVEFEALQNEIAKKAQKQPENLHLILSSFAVRIPSPSDKIMNVTVYVQCGAEVKFNYIVKNYSSEIDPTYFSAEEGKYLLNAHIREDNLDNISIIVADKKYFFSFNNIVECQTLGKEKFNTGIDVCMDNHLSVAKDNFTQKQKKSITDKVNKSANELCSSFFSQILVSNCIRIMPEYNVCPPTQADPKYSYSGCKEGVNIKSSFVFSPQYQPGEQFGTAAVWIVNEPHLCEKTTKLYEEEILYAVRNNLFDKFEAFLEIEFSPEIISKLAVEMIYKNQNQMFDKLLEKKINVNYQYKGGETILHHAVMKGNLAIVNSLLEKGAKVDLPGMDGWKPLYIAVRYGNLQMVEALLKAQADPNQLGQKGKSLLTEAMEKKRPDIAKVLSQAIKLEDKINENLVKLNTKSSFFKLESSKEEKAPSPENQNQFK